MRDVTSLVGTAKEGPQDWGSHPQVGLCNCLATLKMARQSLMRDNFIDHVAEPTHLSFPKRQGVWGRAGGLRGRVSPDIRAKRVSGTRNH